MATERVDPCAIFLLCSRNDVKFLPIFEILLTQLDASFNLQLIHAAVFLLSVNVAGRDEETLVGVELGESAVFDGGLRLPLVTDLDDLLWLTLGVERTFTFQRLRTNVKLAAGSHSESGLLLSAPVHGVFFGLNVLFGQLCTLIEY